MNSELEQDGQQAKVPTFVNIVDQDGIKLSDLKVSGYAELDGCWGNVSIAMLRKSGANLKTDSGMPVSYYWYDEEGEYEAGWYDIGENPLKNGASELGNADEIVFDVGQGICVFADQDYIGCTIDCAGQVFTARLDYPISTDGQQRIGNPHPTSIKLSDITVGGYDEDGLDLDGCWGNVSIAMLRKSGANLKTDSGMPVSYYWYDEEGEYEAGWYDIGENPLKNGASELGNANEIVFAAGQGLVVFADLDYIGCTLNFPALQLNK